MSFRFCVYCLVGSCLYRIALVPLLLKLGYFHNKIVICLVRVALLSGLLFLLCVLLRSFCSHGIGFNLAQLHIIKDRFLILNFNFFLIGAGFLKLFLLKSRNYFVVLWLDFWSQLTFLISHDFALSSFHVKRSIDPLL